MPPWSTVHAMGLPAVSSRGSGAGSVMAQAGERRGIGRHSWRLPEALSVLEMRAFPPSVQVAISAVCDAGREAGRFQGDARPHRRSEAEAGMNALRRRAICRASGLVHRVLFRLVGPPSWRPPHTAGLPGDSVEPLRRANPRSCGRWFASFLRGNSAARMPSPGMVRSARDDMRAAGVTPATRGRIRGGPGRGGCHRPGGTPWRPPPPHCPESLPP